MNDLPDFPFYPDKWLVGVAVMTDQEQLAFLRLLCHQWIADGLPQEQELLERLSGGLAVTEAVLGKFPLTDGKRRNPKLEELRQAQRARLAKRRKGADAANSNKSKSSEGPPPPPPPGDDEGIKAIEDATKKRRAKHDLQESEAFQKFWADYPRKANKVGALKQWAKAEGDKASEEIMTGLAAFSFSDDPQFIPLPATWLSQRRWQDQPLLAKAPKPETPIHDEWNS